MESTKLPFNDVTDRYDAAVQALFANQMTQGVSTN